MTEFEVQVLDNQRIILDRMSFLEQRMSRLEKAITPINHTLPTIARLIDDLHNDYLERTGLIRKEE